MTTNELEELIKDNLETFYQRRLQRLSKLKLKDTLSKKNPYLFRAIGVQDASDIVGGILQAYISSSDETIFGDAFFEPIALAVSGGSVSPSEGVDVAIESEDIYKAISVKSGPNIFNSSQSKRQSDEFDTLRRRLVKLHKKFDPILGSAYGRKNSQATKTRSYRILSGQSFWEELTGDCDFYLKLIELMRDYPQKHRLLFQEEYHKALNRFTKEFLDEFSTEDGSINWTKLTKFNSGTT